MDAVEHHYALEHLERDIFSGLEAAAKDPKALEPEDLAPVDEFHIRGRAATVELARLAGVREGMRVLDVGCGLGGSSCYLATQCACHVTGLDLTPEYVALAEKLSARVGLAGRTRFRHASALEMPFDDESFDVGPSPRR